MLKTKNYKLQTSQGFALILVLLFTAIVLMVIGSIASSLASGANLNRQSKNASESYNLARAAVGDGLNQLKSSQEKNPSFPTDACTAKFKIYYYSSSDYIYDPTSITDIATWIGNHPTAKDSGFYAVSMCTSGSDANKDTIIGKGFFGGQQIALKAKITLKNLSGRNDGIYTCTKTSHDPTGTDLLTGAPIYTDSTITCGTASGLQLCSSYPHLTDDAITNTNCVWDHTQDLIHIYQVGP